MIRAIMFFSRTLKVPDKDEKVIDALKAVQEKAKSYKFCGCYRSHKGTSA